VSENGGNDQDRLTRLLREHGPAQAPPGMADDVMRQVRAEPRPASPSRWRPVALLAAAAIVVVAGVLGISRIGGSSSSSGLAGGERSSAPNALPVPGGVSTSAGAGKTPKAAPLYRSVSRTALGTAFGVNVPACGAHPTYTLHVPAPQLDQAARRLDTLAQTQNGVTVHVEGDATAGRHLTCP
jgi:hypothetical protein